MKGEAHPAATIGLNVQDPIIRFVESLDRGQRIEAIAHELTHFILLYQFGLRLITRRRPSPGNREEVYKYFLDMNKDWFYLLGQIGNTTHHLLLIDYLKEKYGIPSDLHLRLLHHNFHIVANEWCKDQESLYAKGIIAFEYERLIGHVDRVIDPFGQGEPFWKAYQSAQKHFGGYGFGSIPTPSAHDESVLSFLEDLGYAKEDFVFFPPHLSKSDRDERIPVNQ